MLRSGVLMASLAGCMAALASVCAKLATSYEEAQSLTVMCYSWFVAKETQHQDAVIKEVSMTVDLLFPVDENLTDDLPKAVLAVRMLSLMGIFLCNGLMWTLFTKSLQLCSSSVEATVTNTASNFLVTALVSHVLFQERLPLAWWLGSCLILIGLLLIHKGSQRLSTEQKKKVS